MKAIKVENLKKVYNPYSAFSKVALKDVSLEVEESEFICIMGTSGSGKTTLINVLSTIDEATNGKIQINLHNLMTMSENEKALLRKKEIGFIFQNYNLIESLRIKDNILFSLRINNIDKKIKNYGINHLAISIDLNVTIVLQILVPLYHEHFKENYTIPLVYEVIEGEVPSWYQN